MPAIETLQQLCAALSAAHLTARAAAARIGAVEDDSGENAPILVCPADPAFREAQVVRKYDTDEPAHVRLVPAGPDVLSLADLRRAFGPDTPVTQARPSSAPRLAFRYDRRGQPYTCTILVELDPAADDPAAGPIRAVTLRRDIRLD